MNSVMVSVVNSLVNDNCPYNIAYSVAMFEENDFLFSDYNEKTSSVTMNHGETGVSVTIKARKFFGCEIKLEGDPNNIITITKRI